MIKIRPLYVPVGEQVTDKIRIIDEIANQTTFLALSAAIEVPRPGEQGRGFAVVEPKTRELAERSMTAFRESRFVDSDQSTSEDAGEQQYLAFKLGGRNFGVLLLSVKETVPYSELLSIERVRDDR